MTRPIVAVFDFDGTLVDSDEALIAPFLALGIERSRVRLGRLLADECDDLGVTVEDYLDHYDPSVSDPFPGIDDLLASLPRWGLCSNKHPDSGASELARLGWHPTATAFALGAPKSLLPVLTDLGVGRRWANWRLILGLWRRNRAPERGAVLKGAADR